MAILRAVVARVPVEAHVRPSCQTLVRLPVRPGLEGQTERREAGDGVGDDIQVGLSVLSPCDVTGPSFVFTALFFIQGDADKAGLKPGHNTPAVRPTKTLFTLLCVRMSTYQLSV